MTYCNGAGCTRKFKCKRWLGSYSIQMKNAKRRDGTQCVETKGQLSFFENSNSDYFIYFGENQ